MEDNLKKWTQGVVDNLSAYTKEVAEVLKGHHSSILKDLASIEKRLDIFNHSCASNTSLVGNDSIPDNWVQKFSCGFDISLASSTTMKLDQQDNTTLLVKEDTSVSAIPIPLILYAEVGAL